MGSDTQVLEMQKYIRITYFLSILNLNFALIEKDAKLEGVLIVGGMNEKVLNGDGTPDDLYNDIEVYPASCRKPLPPQPMQNAVMANYKGEILSCGGVNTTSPEYGSLALDCFKLTEENIWEPGPTLNMHRTQFYSVMITVGDVLVALFTPYDGRPTIEVYDGERWTLRPDFDAGWEEMPLDPNSGDFVSRGDWGLSFITGDVLLTLDVKTGNWARETLSDIDDSLETGLGSRVLRTECGLLRTGGTNFEITSSKTFFLQEGSSIWKTHPNLNTSRFGHGMALLNDVPTVFGGAEFQIGQVMPVYKSTEMLVGDVWVHGKEMQKGRLGHQIIKIMCG